MKTRVIVVLLAILASSCSADDGNENTGRSKQAVNPPDLDRLVKRAIDRRERGEVHTVSCPMGTQWVDFSFTKTQLAPNTNPPPERVIPVGILMAETKKEVTRLFPDTSVWEFDGVQLKRFASASDRFKNQKRFGMPFSPSGNWSLSWIYLVSWSRFTETDAQTISVPVLLSGEVIKGELTSR